MKTFQMPPGSKTVQKKTIDRQNLLVTKFKAQIDAVLRQATAHVADSAFRTHTFRQPNLDALYPIGEQFYRAVLTEAFRTNHEYKNGFNPKKRKRLARWPLGLPKTFRDLEKLFRDRTFWPRLKKRSRKIMDNLEAEYLKKLRKHFATISPLLQTGEVTPDEVKEAMMKAPEATRASVETKFRTETTTYFAQAQVRFFEGDADILGFIFDSVTDSRRTDICRSRHGLIYRQDSDEHRRLLAENTPSLHWNCRSHLIPLARTTRNLKMLADPSRDPSKVAVSPLPPGWNLQGTEAKTRRK